MTNAKTISQSAQNAIQKAEEAYQEAKDKAEKIMETAKSKLDDAKDKSAEALHETKDKADELQNEIVKYVKENPIKTISAAALVALIAGFVTRVAQ